MQSDFGPALVKFQQNPALFFEKVLGITTLEEYQRGVIQIVADNERTAIAACHDVGKSYLMARIVLWFCTCFPYSKVITTAPTYNQIKNILWSEIRSAHAKALFPLGGKMNLTDWQLSREGDWFAIGFSPRNELTGGEGQGTQSSFQGFHAPHVLVVFDEATGIRHATWMMAEGLLTSANVKFVAIGNPTSRNSEFYNCFRSPAWAKIYLNCFNSPNLIANGIFDMPSLEAEISRIKSMSDEEAKAAFAAYKAPKPYLLSAKWVVASVIKWGLTHPLTVSKIFGKFPEDSEDTLVPLGFVEAAQIRKYNPIASDRKIIGIDVARFGSDSSVMTALHGKRSLRKLVYSKRDTTFLIGAAIQMSRDLWPEGGTDIFVIDETGLGGGLVDGLREAAREKRIGQKTEIRGVQYGAACEDPDQKEKYSNLKARMFGLLGDDVKDPNGLTLLDEAIYLEELPSILYAFNSKGQMVIESKEDYKKRTGRGSPDTADSLALANYGRYDEMEVGAITENHTDFSPPFANSLGANHSW